MDSHKRELIKKIKADTSLSETEKNKKIQELMMGNYMVSQSKSNESKTCSHYEKSCYKFYFDCCKIYDPCKRCHVERNCQSKDNLTISKITCSQCELLQEPGELCIGCGIKFSNSHCGKCQIWTAKEITHCDKCGLCRLGKPGSLFHCDDCGVCFNKPILSENNIVGIDNNTSSPHEFTHECIGKKSQNIKSGYKDSICVVCSENTFNSQSESFPLSCGHFIHSNCYNQYIQLGSYKCPHCKKSIGNLEAHWNFIREQIKLYPLPNDFLPINPGDIVDSDYGKFLVKSISLVDGINKMYLGEFINWDVGKNFNKKKVFGSLNVSSIIKNIYKNIHCNDCGQKSVSKFHFYGLECGKCGSFNTQE